MLQKVGACKACLLIISHLEEYNNKSRRERSAQETRELTIVYEEFTLGSLLSYMTYDD